MVAEVRTKGLLITLPANWHSFPDGRQIVAHGPHDAELIATSSIVDCKESQSLELLTQTLVDEVTQLLDRNAAHPELKISEELVSWQTDEGIRMQRLC